MAVCTASFHRATCVPTAHSTITTRRLSGCVYPGFALHDELDLLVGEAGLTPAQALRAATLTPAEFFRATDSLGTVAPGKLADLVLLRANPLDNIRNVATIQSVVANGRVFSREELDGLLSTGQPKATPRNR